MGVESAMPWVPAPSSEQPPKAKSKLLQKLVLALLALVFLFGLWQVGRVLYIQTKAPLAQVIDKKG
jgi:cytochrome oxidase assembly protein ShyY1